MTNLLVIVGGEHRAMSDDDDNDDNGHYRDARPREREMHTTPMYFSHSRRSSCSMLQGGSSLVWTLGVARRNEIGV